MYYTRWGPGTRRGKGGWGMLEHGICTALWSMARADLLARIIQTRASIDGVK